MKFSIVSILTVATVAFAAPVAQKNTPAASLAEMIQGAVGFPIAFLNGDQKGVAQATAQMTNGAASFGGSFANAAQGVAAGLGA
jgi:hypothetical protein